MSNYEVCIVTHGEFPNEEFQLIYGPWVYPLGVGNTVEQQEKHFDRAFEILKEKGVVINREEVPLLHVRPYGRGLKKEDAHDGEGLS